MSVHAGVWNFDGMPVTQEFLARLGQSVADCGPDSEKTHFDVSVAMLYRAFHVTSESRLERQPYVTTTGKIITWDGRLDNRDELILELSDGLTDDRTDVAIVAAAFEKWETDSFLRLVGDWAIAIWDREKGLVLARDYMGIKRLFYYLKSQRVIWCSHLTALAQCGDRFTLCNEYVAGYLGFWPQAHLTPYSEIHSVPPGSFVRILDGKTSVRPYWIFDHSRTIRYNNDADYEEHFRHLFRQAVRRRLRTDSHILAELSGGLDSSSIVCMADDIVAAEGTTFPRVDTFSFCDRDEPDEEDFFYFTKVEEKRGRIGHHAELRGLGDTYSFEQSTFSPAPNFGYRDELEAAKSDVIWRGRYRVLLSGNGGDQLLGQGLDPCVPLADLIVQLRFPELCKELVEWSLLTRRPWVQLVAEALILLAPASLRVWMTPAHDLVPWVRKSFAQRYRVADSLLPATDGSWLWLPSARHCFQQIVRLRGEMTHARQWAHETRYPFLDRTLSEFLLSIPANQLVRCGQRRSLMRRALVNITPKEILSRRTKSATGRCFAVTLRKHWNELETIVRSPMASALGYIDKASFRAGLSDLRNGRMAPWVGQLWRVVFLELWLRDVVDRGIISVPAKITHEIAEGSAAVTTSRF